MKNYFWPALCFCINLCYWVVTCIPSNYIYNDDIVRYTAIRVDLLSIFLFGFLYSSFIFFGCVTLLGKRVFLLAPSLLFAVFFVNKTEGYFLKENRYEIWSSAFVIEGENLPHIEESELPIQQMYSDIMNKKNSNTFRSRIAEVLSNTQNSEAIHCLSKIILDKSEDKFLRFNSLKSLKKNDNQQFMILSKSIGKTDSLSHLYRIYETPLPESN